ncbi:putative S1/P1 Nuclease [Paratrimastix pyriformis]|uniref:S1/P1 Nuclease n=1 Tax=Paratrimastix pyriformis TaxID=342808 RepID=A0ABQ8UEG6_9EUKA|nr:putative S1/P1 Nuclease [Paratrimastix pyriformis]
MRPTIFVLLLVSASLVNAWHQTGHYLVVETARNSLPPEQRDLFDTIISTFQPRAPLSVAEAAAWADLSKALAVKGQFPAEWHYYDLPLNMSREEVLENIHEDADQRMPLGIFGALKTTVDYLRTPIPPDCQTRFAKSRIFMLFLHLMGDVHMPLHTCAGFVGNTNQTDDGGLRFKLGGGYRNLHLLWDGLLGWSKEICAGSETKPACMKARLQAFTALPQGSHPSPALPEPTTDQMVDTLAGWFLETHNLCEALVYQGIEEGKAPSAAYLAAGQTAALSQLGLAASRLSAVLQQWLLCPKCPLALEFANHTTDSQIECLVQRSTGLELPAFARLVGLEEPPSWWSRVDWVSPVLVAAVLGTAGFYWWRRHSRKPRSYRMPAALRKGR